MITKKDIILDYKASTSGKRALKIDFLKGISKSNVYISKKTGLPKKSIYNKIVELKS